MIKTFKYRLYPTRKQIEAIDSQFNTHRFLYNCALEHRIIHYHLSGKGVWYNNQAHSLKEIREFNEYFSNCNYSSLQQTLRRLDKAYKAFFNRVKKGQTPGFPRFKGKDRFNTIQLSRRRGGSTRRKKAKKLVAKTHEKIANQRLNFLHNIAKILIEENDVIVIEKLQIQNMIKNHHFAKSIHDSGWGTFINVLKGKAEEAGRKVIEINPKGTSQACSVCGKTVKKDLSVRIHSCPYCSSVLNRDYNAALNILNKARTELSVLAHNS